MQTKIWAWSCASKRLHVYKQRLGRSGKHTIPKKWYSFDNKNMQTKIWAWSCASKRLHVYQNAVAAAAKNTIPKKWNDFDNKNMQKKIGRGLVLQKE